MNTVIRCIAAVLMLMPACEAGSGPDDALDARDAAIADSYTELADADADADTESRDTVDDAPGADVVEDAPGPDVADIQTGFLILVKESGSVNSDRMGFVSVSNPPSEEMVSTVTAEVGDCRFLEPESTGTCETFCAWPGYCGPDNVCHEGLPRRWAGDITLNGLNAECSLPVQGVDQPYPYYLGECDPEYPPDLFDEDAVITALAAGCDDMPGFTIRAPGVRRMVTTLPCEGFVLTPGTDLTVSWEPGQQAGDRVMFYLRSANHGGQFGHILCDTADNGSLVVDASLVDMHLAAFNPVPSWGLVRLHSADAIVDGTRVTLEVSSQVSCMYY